MSVPTKSVPAARQAVSERDRAFRKASADPLRIKIVRRIDYPTQGLTAAQIATQLGVPANGLYYHLGVLETAGVIEVVGMERRGRTTERRYAPVAEQPIGQWDVAEPDEILNVFLGILDLMKADVRDAVYSWSTAVQIDPASAPETPYFEGHEWRTSSAELLEFRTQVQALRQTFKDRAQVLMDANDGVEPQGWVTLCFPHGVWQR